MILLTRLDGTEFALNSAHILSAEATPDTLLALTNGERLLVQQSVAEVMERFIAFHRLVTQGPIVHSARD